MRSRLAMLLVALSLSASVSSAAVDPLLCTGSSVTRSDDAGDVRDGSSAQPDVDSLDLISGSAEWEQAGLAVSWRPKALPLRMPGSGATRYLFVGVAGQYGWSSWDGPYYVWLEPQGTAGSPIESWLYGLGYYYQPADPPHSFEAHGHQLDRWVDTWRQSASSAEVGSGDTLRVTIPLVRLYEYDAPESIHPEGVPAAMTGEASEDAQSHFGAASSPVFVTVRLGQIAPGITAWIVADAAPNSKVTDGRVPGTYRFSVSPRDDDYAPEFCRPSEATALPERDCTMDVRMRGPGWFARRFDLPTAGAPASFALEALAFQDSGSGFFMGVVSSEGDAFIEVSSIGSGRLVGVSSPAGGGEVPVAALGGRGTVGVNIGAGGSGIALASSGTWWLVAGSSEGVSGSVHASVTAPGVRCRGRSSGRRVEYLPVDSFDGTTGVTVTDGEFEGTGMMTGGSLTVVARRQLLAIFTGAADSYRLSSSSPGGGTQFAERNPGCCPDAGSNAGLFEFGPQGPYVFSADLVQPLGGAPWPSLLYADMALP